MTTAVHPSSLTLERLALGELSSGQASATREHLKGCGACRAQLESMDAQAASFSGSPHSSPARARLVQADRAWKRRAMVVALLPALAAAYVAVGPLVAAVREPVVATVSPPPARPQVHGRDVLEVRPSSSATTLRRVSLSGREVAFGEGGLEARDGVATSPFVLKHTQVDARIIGFASTVTVTQTFENPFRAPVEALYVFPLPDDAAVDEMTLEAGSRVIRATIQKRETARRMYEEAKSQGRRAALLDQERPNIFTQSVANLLPGETVKVTLRYVAPLKYDDGDYTFNFPMVVGPRFVPGQALPGESQGTGTSADTTRVIDGSRITPPLQRSGRDISVRVHLDAGSPVEQVWSVSHRMLGERRSSSQLEVELDPTDSVPNKDFILRWRVSGASKRAALLASGGAGGPFALMVMPEAPEANAEVLPKEMVFVIDTSCSMSGPPLEAAKRAMRSAIEQMNPDDTFMLVDFASTASTFHKTPLPNTAANVARALDYLDHLPAGGGTNQLEGLRVALDRPEDPRRLRLVLLMTDGYIGNEREIFAAARKSLGHARLFGFGVGSSVNHYLLDRLSEIGRGFSQYVRPDEDPQAPVARFVRRIAKPLMSDVTIDWGGLQVVDVLPQVVPDLFDAQPLIIFGRAKAPGQGVVTVRGSVAGRAVETKLEVTLPEQPGNAPGITSLWARARIEALDRHQDELEQSAVIRDITALGLEYHLVTAYTSLVAVEESAVTKARSAAVVVPSDVPDLTVATSGEATKRPAPPMGVRPQPVNRPDRGNMKAPSGGDDFDAAFGTETGSVDPSDFLITDGRSGGGKQGHKGPASPTGSASTYVQGTTEYFEGETIDGQLVKPDGEYVVSRNKVNHGTLIKVPERLGDRRDDSSFDKAFGTDSGPRSQRVETKREGGYIPPAPGNVAPKETLSTSDIMEAILASKPALAACVAEQKRREPLVTGKIVLRWSVTVSGRAVNIEVLTTEYADKYIASCLKSVVAKLRFPFSETQGAPTTFPFKF